MKIYPKIFTLFFRNILSLYMHSYLNLKFYEKYPIISGPKIFAVNHPTLYDAFPILIYKKTTPPSVLIEEQVWSFKIPKIIFTLSNQVIVYNKTKEKSNITFEDSFLLLKKGFSLLIAPEIIPPGYTGKIRPRKGVIRLALGGKVPVVPVGIWIDRKDLYIKKIKYNYMGKKYFDYAAIPKFRSNYACVFGKPIYFDQYYNKNLTMNKYQELANYVVDEIHKLSEFGKTLFN